MSFQSKIKNLTPPLIWNYLREKIIKNKQNKKNYDPRRWWYGEDLLGDNSRFEEIFVNNGFQSSISILDNEIRDCLIISPKQSKVFQFKDLNTNKDSILSFGNKSKNRSINGRYFIYSNKKKIVEIQNPLSNRWNNCFLNSKIFNNEIEVTNNTDSDLYFACPIFLSNSESSIDSDLKNIFLIVLDQIDYKTFHEVEETNSKSSFISDFFSNSINYENCFSAAEWTLPCFSSIFSGEHPSQHGNFDLKCSEKIKNIVPEDNLIEFLRKKGFSTFGISRSKGHHAGYNFQKYFDRLLYFDDAVDRTVEDDNKFAKKVIDHLEANSRGKNFIFAHYMSSHSPYWKPSINEEINLNCKRFGDSQKEYDDAVIGLGDSKAEPIMDKEKIPQIIDRQKERIKNVDLLLGQLFTYLQKKKYTENSLVILTADHGPNHFGEKNLPMMNRARLNVPLKIFDFKNLKKTNVKEYVCHTDIYSLIKNLVSNKNSGDSIPPYGNKSLPIISESIFNEKYKASVRTDNHTFYFSCKFDPSKFEIILNDVLNNELEIHQDKNIKEEEIIELKIYYYNILIKHLEKSSIIKLIKNKL